MKTSIFKAVVIVVSLSSFSAFAAVPDGLITSKTKLSLWTSSGIRSTTVHVDTNDGVVTLYGKVPTAEQRTKAEKTVRDIVGVRDVKNLLQVVAVVDEKRIDRTDKETKIQAEKLLKADATLKDSKISVKSVDKGIVLLTGDARTFSDHLRAVVIVDRMPGVRRVNSEIKSPEVFGGDERVIFLNQPAPAPTDKSATNDMRISTVVKLRMLTAAQIPSAEISVDTEDGVVTLFGIVPTETVKSAAQAQAAAVPGVLKVENQLEVVATSQKKAVEAKDGDITKDLALTLQNRPEFKKVTTLVKNGTVRLTGKVDSAWDEVNAVRIARQISGVRSVEDELSVDESQQ